METANPTNRVENSAALEKAAKSTKPLREAVVMLAIGEKGVGKTYETTRFFNEEYTVTTPTKLGRKVVIYDTNGEFENVDPISLYDLPKFNLQKVIEIRRILARDPNTFAHIGIDGKVKLLEEIMSEHNSPRGMGLLLEDLNSYATGITSKKMIDVLTTNRHKELDLFIHLQTFRAVPPRIWGNINIMRLHKTGDDVFQIKNKVRNFRLTLLGNLLVQHKTLKDKRFFVFIDYDKNIVYGKFDVNDMRQACAMLLYSSPQDQARLKMLQKSNKKYTEEMYISDLIKEFTQEN